MILEFCENCNFIRVKNNQICPICSYNKFKEINIKDIKKE